MLENKFLLRFFLRCFFLVEIYFALKFSTTFFSLLPSIWKQKVKTVEWESKLNFQFSTRVRTFHNSLYYIIYFCWRKRESFKYCQEFSIMLAERGFEHKNETFCPSQFFSFFTSLKASIYIQRDKLNNSNLFSEV